ncbi:MAG TPA: ABC transporter permease subunit [Anaerolineae bacterium]
MKKIITIIDKEWAEVFKNPMVLLTVLLLPLLFTALPLIILYFMGTTPDTGGAVSDLPPQFAATCGSLSGIQCMKVYLVNQFMMLFMVLPLAIPAAISAYSIVGEKTTRCLEPLLATPITTAELITGKAAAAAIPAILATWLGFVIFVVGGWFIARDPAVASRFVDGHWLLAVLVVGPLMAVASVNVSIMVSSRVSDPRAAEQISLLVVLPLLGIFFAQMAGLVLMDTRFILILAAALAVVDVGLVYLGVGLFQREAILTRWK